MAAREAPPSPEAVRAWARGHDATSLHAIVEHRETLLARQGDIDAALALGRLVDVEGADERVVAMLIEAEGTCSDCRTA